MIWGMLSGLGLGEQLFAAAALLAVAWYLLRALSLAGTVGVAVTSGVMYVVVTAVAVAIALGLGWLDPQPGVIRDTIGAARDVIEGVLVDWLADRLSGAGL
jgi:hypothetical protein